MTPLHITTPIWASKPLSVALGTSVLLKMEALQPVGSFKIRGMGRACQASCQAGATHLICSSGGNAGYAVAYAGRKLSVDVTIVVPKTTSDWMRQIISRERAVVIEHGESWDDAHVYASELAREDGVAYIHPFDDSRVWRGHASIIEEVYRTGPKPGAIVVSVGGGGLLCGLLEGLHRVRWTDVPVIAVETEGAASFAASVASGRLITLDTIESIATTLGARTVTSETLAWTSRHSITPWIVSDRAAIRACLHFADDHRILVEPACGAALSTVYDKASPLDEREPVLVIVCGGAGVSLALLREWDSQVLN
ncbi:pyridoxal-phosphate dependent enzyme [Candidatus Poribacteria bacterium]|nr:pyridoxal-phosphate dependent enzyme [Candidatus Poribacteria bacterium]